MTRTRSRWALAWLGLATLAACEVHETSWAEGSASGYGGDPPYPGEGGDLCHDYCGWLVSCGAIEFEAFDACAAVCSASYDSEPGSTESACLCTLAQSCDDVLDDPCDDTPVPPSGTGSTGTGTGTGAGGDGAGGDGAGGDGAGGDGAGGDGGEGGSGSIPCAASCECPEGYRCVDGYCEGDEPPPPTCEDNCDCLAGQICAGGQCVDP